MLNPGGQRPIVAGPWPGPGGISAGRSGPECWLGRMTPGGIAFGLRLSAASGRDADRHRAWANLDAQFLAGRARTAIKLEADLLVKPDTELLSLRDHDEGRLLWMPSDELTE